MVTLRPRDGRGQLPPIKTLGEQQRLELALRAARAGTWEFEVSTGLNTWSEELWPLYGLPLGTPATYDNWASSVNEEDLPRVASAVQQSISRGTAYAAEWRVRSTTGPTRWLLGQGQPIRNDEGQVTHMVGVVVDITDRKNAEAARLSLEALRAVRASEARLRAVLEAVPSAVFIAPDPSATRIVPNRFAAELMRVSVSTNVSQSAPAQELIPFRVLRDGVELPPGKMPVQRAAREGTEFRDATFTLDFGTHGQRHFMGNAVPLLDEAGHSTGAVGAFADVTRLKAVEEELRRREALLRAYFESPAQGVAVSDGAGRIADANQAFCSYLGYSREELLGRGWRELTHEADVSDDEPAFSAIMAGTLTAHAREKRYRRKDGSVVWGSLVATAVPETDPTASRKVVAFVRDTTQEHLSAEALRASEDRFRALAERAPLGVLEVDEAGQLLFVNDAWLEQSGLTRDEALVLENRVQRLHPDDRELVAPFRERAFSESLNEALEVRYRWPSGREKWVHIVARMLPARQGSRARLLMLTIDVTRERELARNMAQAARLAAMGSIAAGLAHHFNNPLAAQLSGQQHALDFVRTLKSRLELGVPLKAAELLPDVNDAIDALNDAQDAANRVARLVKDMGRLDEPESRRVVVPLADVARASLRWVAPALMRGASVTIEDLDAPAAKVSEQQLEHVIASLVTNALQAVRPQVHPRVTIRLSVREGRAVLEVADEGTGIAAADLPRVFDPFFTTRPVGERRGAGLGLSICHVLVEAHGGTIGVSSQPGAGTTVRIELPAP